MKDTIQTVANEVSGVLQNVDEKQAMDLSHAIGESKRIFISGEGRSGFMGKAIAMRLMHGGFDVYVTGETITPSISENDLLIAISGSGSTSSIDQYANKAQETGAKVFLVTTNPDSKIGKKADGVLVVPAATKKRLPEEPETVQPLGNQFDQSVHLLLDAVIISTINEKGETDYDQMTKRHANLE
ncbi:6-phospho-3-hexuloisomerase [Pontibacillus yanchengensis]|uniref:6-phospho-3-hexuloisomerase n=2 Tax=Pontibacillus yanchengensis TaxID=462910 RepID=A0ACC7VD44_9BACI|nr:6-phospho-3-hexuloisomerase [Pontibacillus yanchengensis]MYL32018.1 6-phospho-3-hexuloisomerase [Pontibacillus yanchengensis]MYL52595.1 6-phospho-3-hexuloisomerase [Pontibacillus yanchengensis]